MYVSIYVFVCVCVYKKTCVECSHLCQTWCDFTILSCYFENNPGDFYVSLPRAAFHVFPRCWLTFILWLTCMSEN